MTLVAQDRGAPVVSERGERVSVGSHRVPLVRDGCRDGVPLWQGYRFWLEVRGGATGQDERQQGHRRADAHHEDHRHGSVLPAQADERRRERPERELERTQHRSRGSDCLGDGGQGKSTGIAQRESDCDDKKGGHREHGKDRRDVGQDRRRLASGDDTGIGRARNDESDRVEGECQRVGARREAEDVLEHERRRRDVGEQCAEREGSRQQVTKIVTVGEQPAHAPERRSDAATRPAFDGEGLPDREECRHDHHSGDDGDGPEHATLIDQWHQRTAEERGDDRREAADRGQQAERADGSTPIGQIPDDRSRDDDASRSRKSLNEPEGNQQLDCGGEGAANSRQRADRHRDEQRLASPEAVR